MMDAQATNNERYVAFRNPRKFLANLDAAVTAKVIASAADVALIVEDGVIKDVALGAADLAKEGVESAWRGKKWVETVTIESRPKIEDLLRTSPNAEPHWRQVNHPSSAGADLPIKYTAVRTGERDRIVALGRDLRSVAAMQQRLVEAHQGLERDYARLRETEARYRLLFQSVGDAVLIVNADTFEIDEANPAAARVIATSSELLAGGSLLEQFLKRSQRAVEAVAAEAIAAGMALSEPVRLKDGREIRLAMSPFRMRERVLLIVRLIVDAGESADTRAGGEFLRVLENLPDGLVVAGADLYILSANNAFAEMTRLSSNRAAVGRRLVEFLCRSSTDLNVLIATVKTNGYARNFATVLRDQFGVEERVEVAAVAAAGASGDVYGFSVRNVARRLDFDPRLSDRLPNSVDQLAGLVGKVALKDIVRESTDLIEKLCIEAALEITNDNRASAAEMLGLSRQGLYSKIKRFGIDD